MPELCSVDISDYYYLCIKYALRRIGSNLSVGEFLKLPKETYSKGQYYPAGTILVWETQEKAENVPCLIADYSTIVTARIIKNIHVGVMEGANPINNIDVTDIISELTYFSTDRHTPYIQCRRLSMFLIQPDYIIKRETIKNAERLK